MCIQSIYGFVSQIAQLKVENLAQTTIRFPPIDIALPPMYMSINVKAGSAMSAGET